MKKTILFILIVMFLISGCVKEEPTQVEKVAPKLSVEWCEQNASICEPNEIHLFGRTICKNACFIISALQFNELSTCEKIDVQSGDASKDECYVKFAKKLNNLELCENVVKDIGRTSKDDCLQGIALQKGDHSICELMELESQYTVFKSSKEVRVNHFSRDVCFYGIGVATNNVDLCKKVSLNAQGKQKDRGSRKACITWIAAKLNDISICDNIEVTAVDKDACIISTAAFNNRPNLCEAVEEATYAYAGGIVKHTKIECYFRVGVANNDLAICDKLPEEERRYTKESCVEYVEYSLEKGVKPGEPKELVLDS